MYIYDAFPHSPSHRKTRLTKFYRPAAFIYKINLTIRTNPFSEDFSLLKKVLSFLAIYITLQLMADPYYCT